jgi:ferrochelatase
MNGDAGSPSGARRTRAESGVLLVSHGTVDRLDDLPAFVTNVRRGQAPAPDVTEELRRRYEAIGGISPLNGTSALLAERLGGTLGVPVAWANRLWKPYVRDVLRIMAAGGVRRVVVVPLAPFSAHVYEADAKQSALAHAETAGIEIACVTNWGQHPKLVSAFVERIDQALAQASDRDRTTLILTAHSLPRAIVDRGDPYERDVRAAAEAIADRVSQRIGRPVRWALAFQSQGMSGAGSAWLGPDVRTVLEQAAVRGDAGVVVAAIGFLADHVETLYDLDIEARTMARERGLAFARARSLDADADLVEILGDLARPLVLNG